MGGYVPPAGLGRVLPQEPARGVYIGSGEQFGVDVLQGVKILGGLRFDDVLGGFYPVVINPAGGITINSAGTTLTSIAFHNAAVSGTDELIFLGAANSLFFAPSGSVSVNNAVVIADRSTGSYLGWVFYPALTSGGITQPEIDVSSPAGTANLVWRHGANYISLTGAASGLTPVIDGTGVDTNVSLNLRGKGTGAIGLAVQNANYWSFSGAGAGLTPVVDVVGSDTNIGLNLRPKGTGIVGFIYASTALGGGAGATLGTIGGSGPATAGQNSWLQVNINGANRWIPLWA